MDVDTTHPLPEFEDLLDDLASLADAYEIASRTFARDHTRPLASMCFARMMDLIAEHCSGAQPCDIMPETSQNVATPEKSRTECRHRALSDRQAPQR